MTMKRYQTYMSEGFAKAIPEENVQEGIFLTARKHYTQDEVNLIVFNPTSKEKIDVYNGHTRARFGIIEYEITEPVWVYFTEEEDEISVIGVLAEETDIEVE